MSDRRLARLAALAALVGALGCQEVTQGEVHPPELLYYPVGIAADPQGQFLYVVNGDFDLAYRGGTVVAVDTATHRVIGDSAVHIGAYGGEIALLTDDAGTVRAGYVPVRQGNAVQAFHVRSVAVARDGGLLTDTGLPDGIPYERCADTGAPAEACREEPRLLCSENESASSANAGCDKRFRVTSDDNALSLVPPDDPDRSGPGIGDDPFGALVVSGQELGSRYLVVGSLAGGLLSLLRLDAEGLPTLVNDQFVVAGLHSLAYSPATRTVVATSRLSSLIHAFEVREEIVNGERVARFGAGHPFASVGGSTLAARGIAFNAPGTRLFVASQNPSSLLLLDASRDQTGTFQLALAGTVDLPAAPSGLFVAPSGPDGAERVYAILTNTDEIWVIDPVAQAPVDRIRTGRAPYYGVYARNAQAGTSRAYVTEFEEHAIAVIELDPQNLFYHQVVAHIR